MADALQGAGDFTIDELSLITTSGLRVNLIPNVVKLTIFEDINQSCISGTITIQDSMNLSSHGPIIGQEFLSMKVRTSSVQDDDGIIDFTKNLLAVHSLTAREKVGNNVQIFNLSFVSMELVRNQRIKVKKSFTLPWSDIVLSMLVNQLQTKKNIFVEKTAGVKKYIAPNIRPLDVVNTARDQSVAAYKSSPTYMFYETLKGFNFRTLASLYNEKPFMEYTTYVKGALVGKNGVVDLIKDLNNVLGYEIVANNDTLLNYRTGMYASELIKHDIRNKSISRKVYNYHDNFENEDHIVSGVKEGKTEYPLASSVALNPSGQRVSDFPARTFVVPISQNGEKDAQYSTPSDTNVVSARNPQVYLQQRVSQMNQLENGISIRIEAHGNTVVSAGDIVRADIPYTGFKTGSEVDDPVYKGEFLVKRVRHDFDYTLRSHRTNYVLVKDSIETAIPDDGEETIFSAKNSYFEDKETFYPKRVN